VQRKLKGERHGTKYRFSISNKYKVAWKRDFFKAAIKQLPALAGSCLIAIYVKKTNRKLLKRQRWKIWIISLPKRIAKNVFQLKMLNREYTGEVEPGITAGN
jgi:hypothetical protein